MTTEELPMQPGRVPVGELRALLKDMRKNIEWEREHGRETWGDGLEVWADELEERISKYD